MPETTNERKKRDVKKKLALKKFPAASDATMVFAYRVIKQQQEGILITLKCE